MAKEEPAQPTTSNDNPANDKVENNGHDDHGNEASPAAADALQAPRPGLTRPGLPRRRRAQDILAEKRQRWMLVLFQALATLFLVGAPLGWGPMKLMLETNGNFGDLCTKEENEQGVVCPKQSSRLLTVGLLMLTTQLLSPFLGYFMDRVGPKNFSVAMAVLGMAGMAITCVPIGWGLDPLLFVGFPILTICSWMGSLLIVQLGFYFEGQAAARVIFILNTLFDSGALTYWILWLIQDISGSDSLNIWIGYMVVTGCIFAGLVYYWRVAKKEVDHVDENFISTRYSRYESLSQMAGFEELRKSHHSKSMRFSWLDSSRHKSVDMSSFTDRGKSREGRISHSAHNNVAVKDNKEILQIDEEAKAVSDSAPDNQSTNVLTYKLVADREPMQQLTSGAFLLLCLFFGIQVTGTNWNLSTQRDFLAYLGDDEEDNRYLSIFSLLTPVSILGAPAIDYAILHYGWSGALQGVNLLGIVYSLIKVVSDDLNVQIIGFVIFSFSRSFLFGISSSFLPNLISSPVIGRAAGVMFGIAGATFYFTIPLGRMAINQYDGNFFVPNLIFLLLNIPSVIAVSGLRIFLRKEDEVKEWKELGLFRENA